MSEVTRYDMVEHSSGMREMEKTENGDYVTFKDFELATKARDGVFAQIVEELKLDKIRLDYLDTHSMPSDGGDHTKAWVISCHGYLNLREAIDALIARSEIP